MGQRLALLHSKAVVAAPSWKWKVNDCRRRLVLSVQSQWHMLLDFDGLLEFFGAYVGRQLYCVG